MSDVRHTHRGYWGVLMGMAVPWYGGLAATFFGQGRHLSAAPSYRLVLHYVSADVWGFVYSCVAIALLVTCNVRAIPHRWVRVATFLGWLLTIFFLTTFILYDIDHGIPVATLIPAFTTMAIIEYRALVEPETHHS